MTDQTLRELRRLAPHSPVLKQFTPPRAPDYFEFTRAKHARVGDTAPADGGNAPDRGEPHAGAAELEQAELERLWRRYTEHRVAFAAAGPCEARGLMPHPRGTDAVCRFCQSFRESGRSVRVATGPAARAAETSTGCGTGEAAPVPAGAAELDKRARRTLAMFAVAAAALLNQACATTHAPPAPSVPGLVITVRNPADCVEHAHFGCMERAPLNFDCRCYR